MISSPKPFSISLWMQEEGIKKMFVSEYTTTRCTTVSYYHIPVPDVMLLIKIVH